MEITCKTSPVKAQFTAFEPFRKIALSYVGKQEVIGY
jgi:hypothetical protein